MAAQKEKKATKIASTIKPTVNSEVTAFLERYNHSVEEFEKCGIDWGNLQSIGKNT